MNSMKDALTEALQHPITEERRRRPQNNRRNGQAAKIPAGAFLWSALGSLGASLTLRLMGQKDAAKFVGQWAPAFFLIGMYNKLSSLNNSTGR